MNSETPNIKHQITQIKEMCAPFKLLHFPHDITEKILNSPIIIDEIKKFITEAIQYTFEQVEAFLVWPEK